MSSSKYLMPHHDGAGWVVLTVAAFMFAFAKYIIIWAIVSLMVWGVYVAGYSYLQRSKRRQHMRLAYDRELRWRADQQHLAYLRGESYGTYGDYQPATFQPTEGW